MAKANFYLKDPKAKKETLIYLQFTYNNKRLRLYTGEYVHPAKWDFKQKRPKKDIELNRHLNLIAERILKAYNEITRSEQLVPSSVKLRLKFEEVLRLQDMTDDFFNHFETFCEERSLEGVTPGTIRTYKQLVKNLKLFITEKRFTLEYDKIDDTFYSKFTGFLFAYGLTNNTVGKNIKTLKTFLFFATRKGWNRNEAFKYFKVLQEKVESIYLSKDEIKDLYEYDLSDQPNYERVRDLFVIGCWTGLRFSDFSQIKPENITTDGRDRDILKITMEKTRSTVKIPLHHFVRMILEKYDNVLPKCHSNQDMNRKLKEIGQWVGLDTPFIGVSYRGKEKHQRTSKKFELLTTHTARRSFATNLYYDGLPSRLIMQITGHSTESSFLKYIKVDSEVAVARLEQMFNQYEQDDKRGSNLKVV